MEANTPTAGQIILTGARTLLRGAGQVMFQNSAITGLFFLAGIFWGSYECHVPEVAWGAVVGVAASTLAGYMVGLPDKDGADGLWGFNGILVGCAFPTFLANTWLMWISLIFFAMATTWVRQGFNNVIAPYKTNSYTFPFVFLTWVFLLAARMLGGIDPSAMGEPELVQTAASAYHLDTSFPSLIVYWLKGVSQVFLVNSWVTGILFLVGLALCSRWAAFYAALASAISLALAILYKADPSDIASGLYGFSPVLTGIALGCTFFAVNWKTCLWAIAGIAATFFVQVAMDVLMEPWGIATLTGPFCVATWLFVLPQFKFSAGQD